MKDFYNLLAKNIGILIIGIIVLIIGASSKIVLDKYTIEIENLFFQIMLVSIGIVLIATYLWNHLPFSKKDSFSIKSVLNKYKSYEWQWAGQNWLGKVDLKPTNEGNYCVDVHIKKLFLGGHDKSISLKYGPTVLKNINGSKGVIKIDKDKLELKDLFVERKVFNMYATEEGMEMENIKLFETIQNKIEGELFIIPAFAGKIKYHNTSDNTSHEGDMILVPYTSHINP